MRNHWLARALAACILMSLLAGCGAVSSLIPDQSVRDPLKLNNVGIRATIGETRVIGRAEKLAGPFANIGSLPLNPRDFRILQPIRSIVRVTVPSGTLPPALTLRDISLTLTVIDANGAEVTLDPATLPGPIECERIEGTVADYALKLGPYILDQNLGGKKDAVLNILRSGGENFVKGVLIVDVLSAPTLPDGSTITFWFEEGTGVVEF